MAKIKPKVALVMGSDSDYPKLEGAVNTLREFGVPFEVHVMSAHRTPEKAATFAANAEKNGLQVIMAAAGGAAHLAGVIAGHTILPVIGIPISGTSLSGFDSLLSTVQMPAGIPVATVAVGSAGGTNAALLAVQILARADSKLAAALRKFKKDMVKKVESKNAALQKLLAKDN
ncbi:MAG: 5-(carboxyamino)imidazole ribonucleotide mutase [Planctomycetes bacterium]|nr:5-(carboxyamino)imidazole ribonucleotide mutase [Planctomycetota bacterium]